MANKYVSHGNTYCGDGTSPDAAVSAGAVGAWNNLINVFDKAPAYGSVSDGDVIYIRTKISGVAVTVSDSGTCNIGGATSGVVTYVADDGTIWGESGVLEYTIASGYGYIFANNLEFYGNNLFKFILAHNSATAVLCVLNIAYVAGVIVYHSVTGSGVNLKYSTNGTYENCEFYIRSTYVNGTAIFGLPNYGAQQFLNCYFDFTGAGSEVVFPGGAIYGGWTRVVGGTAIPTAPTQRLVNYYASYGAGCMITGLAFPKEMLNYSAYSATSQMYLGELMISNMPSRPFDFFRACGVGSCDFIAGDNYPYLNAILPDGSNTGWSFRVSGGTSAYKHRPVTLPIIQKWYSQSTAQKTLSVEFLVNEAFVTPELGHLKACFNYINSSNAAKSCTAYLAGTSTAGWSALVYGAQTYVRYKLAVQTSDAIKENSMITAQVLVGYPPTNVGDFMFVDPDIGVA